MSHLALPLDNTTYLLFSFSLITRLTDSENFTIHPLVHDWARERLPDDQRVTMFRKALTIARVSFQLLEDDCKARERPLLLDYMRNVMPHLAAVEYWMTKICKCKPQILMIAEEYRLMSQISERYNKLIYNLIIAEQSSMIAELSRLRSQISEPLNKLESYHSRRIQVDESDLRTL